MTSTTTTAPGPDGLEFLLREWPVQDATGAVLIIHGVYEHSGRWEHVGAFFAERGYATSAYDLRGHGRTAGPRIDCERFDQFRDDLEWRLTALGAPERPVFVYAHSLGGLIATWYATSERPQPAGYAVNAPALGSNTPAVLVGVGRAIHKIAPGFRLADKPKGEQLSSDPEVGAAYFADPLVTFKATTRFAVGVFDAMADANARLQAISTPMRVTHGTDDTLVPPWASAPLAGVTGVERELLPGLRHEVHNEPSWRDVLGAAADWFDGLSTG